MTHFTSNITHGMSQLHVHLQLFTIRPIFFTIIIMVIIITHVVGSNWVNMGPMKHQLPFLNNTNGV